MRKLAAQRLAHEKPGQTLQATALVHEAYIRLVASERRGVSPTCPEHEPRWDNRGHFFAAAEAMRRILVERARRKPGPQQGGHLKRVDLDLASLAETPPEELLALDEALARFAEAAPE